jgi:Ca-activated chloride channel family protein
MQTPMGPIKMPVAEDLDEPLLKAIAETTGGFYGRAGDGDALRNIMEKIDKLEKTKVKQIQFTQYAEKFGPWAYAAMAVLLFEILAGCTIFRKIP